MLADPYATPAELLAAQQQFQREAQMLAALAHPNLPGVYDYFTENGKYYLVMEYIQGETLQSILNRTPGFLLEAGVARLALAALGGGGSA